MSKVAKQALRRAIKLKVGQVRLEEFTEQSKYVCNTLTRNPHFCNANSVGIFMSMPQLEVDTYPIIKHCFDRGKAVYLPKCQASSTMGNTMTFLRVNNLNDVDSLQPAGKYNLREPTHGEDVLKTGRIDVILVPGVAFTQLGHRLGHGAGYYDKFLTEFRQCFGRVPHLIGICLADQLVESLPIENHDWKMDEVIVGDSKKLQQA